MQNALHTWDENWGPLSDTISAGIPCNLKTCCSNNLAVSDAVGSFTSATKCGLWRSDLQWLKSLSCPMRLVVQWRSPRLCGTRDNKEYLEVVAVWTGAGCRFCCEWLSALVIKTSFKKIAFKWSVFYLASLIEMNTKKENIDKDWLKLSPKIQVCVCQDRIKCSVYIFYLKYLHEF